jgi:hypothetical protein
MGKKKISWIPIAIFFFTVDELAGVNLMSSPGPIWILSGSYLDPIWGPFGIFGCLPQFTSDNGVESILPIGKPGPQKKPGTTPVLRLLGI